MDKIQKNIIKYFQEKLGKNIVSIYTIGSFLTEDFIDDYSDIDLIVFVKKTAGLPHSEHIKYLSDKNKIETGASYISYDDFINRAENNEKANRFFSNISALEIKNYKAKLLFGKDLAPLLPENSALLTRHFGLEIRENYSHAKSDDLEKNIFEREPKKWVSYIINMSNDLLMAKGIFSRKKDIAKNIHELYPKFGSISAIEKALELRTEKRVDFSNKESNELKSALSDFLEDYLATAKQIE